jgi:hypothetical protein
MESSNNTSIKIIVGVVVVALAGVGIWQLNKTDSVVPEQNAQNSTSTPSVEEAPTVTTTKYRNGTYSAEGTYTSPAMKEEVAITLVIENDIVTDATFTGKATNEVSVKLQDFFAQGYKAQVVGKNINSISLTVVNGSSLTPKGFEDALVKIKAQALVQA